MADASLYRIKKLKQRYNGRLILDIDALEIKTGSIVGMVGHNGSGKSTLLKLLAFAARPSSGTIEFKGRMAQPFMDRVRFTVTLLPQDPYLMKRTVYRNIAYGLQLRGRKVGLKDSIYNALAQVGLSGDEFAKRQWHELSGGEAQRVALAARLALRPEVLLLDEPTSNVDIYSSQLIKSAVLKARQKYGTTLIVASHDRQWLSDICDDIVSIFRGRITAKNGDNLILGAWRHCRDDRCEKILADGQRLILPSPAQLSAVACIDPEAVRLIPTTLSDIATHFRLKGTISRLNLATKIGRIRVSLRVADLTLSASCDVRQIERETLYPGRTVWIEIPDDAVSWMILGD